MLCLQTGKCPTLLKNNLGLSKSEALCVDVYAVYDFWTSEAGSLNKNSSLASALRVAKFIIVTDRIWVTLSPNPPLTNETITSSR
jgi:hypothetical protein